MKQRIHYAILLQTFRDQHGLAPAYITDLLHEQRATQVLHSATNNDLYVPPSRSRYVDRTFSISALPSEMKTTSCLVTFKRLLRTHLPGCIRIISMTYLFLFFLVQYLIIFNINFLLLSLHVLYQFYTMFLLIYYLLSYIFNNYLLYNLFF